MPESSPLAHRQVALPAKRRRWLRFSLRGLLLLTAIVACWLGVQVNKAREQQAAIAAIDEAGGTVWVTRQVYPKWLGNVIGQQHIHAPTIILIDYALVPPDVVTQLQRVPSVEKLYVTNGTVPESLQKQLPRIQIENVGVPHAP